MSRAGVVNDSSPYHARKVSSGTCVMTCALLRCSNALGVEYEHCCPCAFFLHGTPPSPLGTAVLANATYKAGCSPWSMNFSHVRHCTEKQTRFSDYYAHDRISARSLISPREYAQHSVLTLFLQCAVFVSWPCTSQIGKFLLLLATRFICFSV